MKKSLLMLSMATLFVAACGSSGDYRSSESPVSESSVAPKDAKSYNDETMDYAPAPEEESNEISSSMTAGNGTAPGSAKMVSERLFSSAAVAFNVNDSLRPFIITADLRFRVENVEKSTYAIEDVVIANKGYVESTYLHSTVQSQRTIPISRDSSLEQIDYVLENRMTLRIPSVNLDKVLRTIGAESEFFEHRNIVAENIRFDLIEKDLRKKRLARYQTRLGKAIDDKGKKLESIESAEEKLLHAEEMADQNTVEQLRQLDRVEYSTVEVFIYQTESVFTKKISNRASIAQYEPSFWSKLGDAFMEGWEGVQEFFLALMRGWFVLLLLGIILWYLLKWRKKNLLKS